MYNDDDMRQAYNEGYEAGKANDVNAVLADVRAELSHLANYVNDDYVSQTIKECIKDLEKISEHFN